MRFTLSVFVLLFLLGAQACKNKADEQKTATAIDTGSEKIADVKRTEAPKKQVVVIAASEFESFMKINATAPVVDLRSAEEFKKGHIGRAVNVPFFQENFEDKIKPLRDSSRIAIYCANGVNSVSAAEIMEKLGFKRIKILDQGVTGWTAAQKELVTK